MSNTTEEKYFPSSAIVIYSLKHSRATASVEAPNLKLTDIFFEKLNVSFISLL